MQPTIILDTVEHLKRDNPAARRAFDAIVASGKSRAFADAELIRVVVGWLREASQGRPDRLTELLTSLAAGTPANKLFADETDERASSFRSSRLPPVVP